MEITDEMVELGARAIWEAQGRGPWSHYTFPMQPRVEGIKSDLRGFARAVLQAALSVTPDAKSQPESADDLSEHKVSIRRDPMLGFWIGVVTFPNGRTVTSFLPYGTREGVENWALQTMKVEVIDGEKLALRVRERSKR